MESSIQAAIRTFRNALEELPATDEPLEEMLSRGLDRGKYDATLPIRQKLRKAADLLNHFETLTDAQWDKLPQPLAHSLLKDLAKLAEIARSIPAKCQLQPTGVVPPSFHGQETSVAKQVEDIHGRVFQTRAPLRSWSISARPVPAEAEIHPHLHANTFSGLQNGVADRPADPSPDPKSSMPKRDFFISYNHADKTWAEWIAWTLEEAGYSVIIDAWDFRPGRNFVLEMQRATSEIETTIPVLSPAYLKAEFTQPEWASAFVQDPQGKQRKLIPVRIAECTPMGLLAPVTYVDLVGLSEEEARIQLLLALKARAKPKSAPTFPGMQASASPRVAPHRPTYPGTHPQTIRIPWLALLLCACGLLIVLGPFWPSPSTVPNNTGTPNDSHSPHPPITSVPTPIRGKMYTFGIPGSGATDTEIASSATLSLIEPEEASKPENAPYLVPYQPPGTTGLMRRLNPKSFYVACSYDVHMFKYLKSHLVLVRNPRDPKLPPVKAKVVERGPTNVGKYKENDWVIGLSPALADKLGLSTNDEVEISFEPN
jgi:hypothetical protein